MTVVADTPAATRDIPFGRPMIGDEERAAVDEVLRGHMLTHGPRCADFERRFAELIGVKHAVATSSCTTALHLALVALDIGPGDEVIVPAETHVATAHVVEHCGARPLFADVSRATGNIDPDAVRAAIGPKTRAIIVVHYLGLPCDMDALVAVADGAGIPIVEDCALALGARHDGKTAGALGMAGCFSFYPVKHITTMEGGMLVTDDDRVAELARRKRAFGYDKGLAERKVPGIYDIAMLGYNYRMSEAQAAVGLAQLDRLDGFLAKRRANSDALHARLADIDGVTTFPLHRELAESARYCVNAVLPEDGSIDRGAVIAALNAAGVGTSVHYPVALPLSSYYREKYGHRPEQFPVARWISDQAISLPCGPHLETDDMHYIADRLGETLAGLT